MFHFQPLLNVSWDLTREEMETDTLREVHLICDILKHSPVYPELSSIYTSYSVVAAWAFAKKKLQEDQALLYSEMNGDFGGKPAKILWWHSASGTESLC